MIHSSEALDTTPKLQRNTSIINLSNIIWNSSGQESQGLYGCGWRMDAKKVLRI